jgi:uncharacterized protein YjhX (UPF0386 family)
LAEPSGPTAAGVLDRSGVVHRVACRVEVGILPNAAERREAFADCLAAERVDAGAIVRVTCYVYDGLMKSTMLPDPAFDDLQALKRMTRRCSSAGVGVRRDNKPGVCLMF